MRMLKIILLSLAGLVIVVLGVGALLPKDFEVERSIHIDAPPEVVFDQVNSLRNWNTWSPWIERDPSIKSSYSGPESGVGATVTWTSDRSGSGRQTITLSKRAERIETSLDFGDMGKPHAYWTFEPSADGVEVTWGLRGTASGVLGGYFAKMMDGWVGADYERGLERLKEISQTAAAAR